MTFFNSFESVNKPCNTIWLLKWLLYMMLFGDSKTRNLIITPFCYYMYYSSRAQNSIFLRSDGWFYYLLKNRSWLAFRSDTERFKRVKILLLLYINFIWVSVTFLLLSHVTIEIHSDKWVPGNVANDSVT